MPDQFNLFGADSAHDDDPPEGFRYAPDLISAADARVLIEQIAALPLAEFQFGEFTGKRRVISFGWRYDFGRRVLDKVDDIPAFRLASRPGGVRARSWCVAALVMHVSFAPQAGRHMAAIFARRRAAIGLRAGRRSPHSLGAQHPGGRRAALLRHVPKSANDLIVARRFRETCGAPTDLSAQP
jgi:hypothetical protein